MDIREYVIDEALQYHSNIKALEKAIKAIEAEHFTPEDFKRKELTLKIVEAVLNHYGLLNDYSEKERENFSKFLELLVDMQIIKTKFGEDLEPDRIFKPISKRLLGIIPENVKSPIFVAVVEYIAGELDGDEYPYDVRTSVRDFGAIIKYSNALVNLALECNPENFRKELPYIEKLAKVVEQYQFENDALELLKYKVLSEILKAKNLEIDFESFSKLNGFYKYLRELKKNASYPTIVEISKKIAKENPDLREYIEYITANVLGACNTEMKYPIAGITNAFELADVIFSLETTNKICQQQQQTKRKRLKR